MVSVIVIGDAALDVTVSASTPPRTGEDVPAAIGIGIGGQAANVAVRLARHGVAVALASPLAEDAVGGLIRARLAGVGVEVRPLPAERSTIVVAMLGAAGERSMLSDRVGLDADATTAAVGGATWVHCSGYALADDASGDAIAARLHDRGSGTRLSVAGGSFGADRDRAARVLQRLEHAGVDLLVVDRREASHLLGVPDGSPPELARRLAALARVPVVTHGAAGSVAVVEGALLDVAGGAAPRPAVDATGAGDAYVARMIAMLLDAWPPNPPTLRAAMLAASAAGAEVAAVVGAQSPIAGERT